jgi:hypothetical protein
MFLLLATFKFTQCAMGEETRMQPSYPPLVTDEATLLSRHGAFLEMPEAELLALVPPQGGFFFQDCPNCDQGDEDNQLTWDLSLGTEHARCRYCQAVLPSETYPENGEVSIAMPASGKMQVFRFYQDANGHKYFFEGRRWFEQRELMEKTAYGLAQLYALDPVKYAEAGRRAALILLCFAEVYPDYIVHFDYPHKEKLFFPGDDVSSAQKIDDGPYRLSKWSWWAYMDISSDLLRAYDLLRAGGVLDEGQQGKIESQLFNAMLDFVSQYDGTPLNNMHPTLWADRIIASRVLDRPEIVEQTVAEMSQLIAEEFTYDGMWSEGTPSYHLQTVGGLQHSLRLLRPDLTGAAFDTWLVENYPALSRAIHAVEATRLPNGHYASIHDSWPQQQSAVPPGATPPALLPGMGYAVLSSGTTADDAMQAHLKYSGRFGHEHYDSLSLLLYANGRELLSDIGYSHTKARAWTMTTISHNTVAIDQLNQPSQSDPRRCMGNTRLFNVTDPSFQIVQADAHHAYPGVSNVYQRTLVSIGAQAPQPRYVVDVFQVEGGQTHDWFLHGSADQTQSLELSDGTGKALEVSSLESLLPPGFQFTPSKSNIDFTVLQGPSTYGYFRELQSATTAGEVIATFRFDDDSNRGLRTWIVGDAARSTQFIATKSWAVRGTGPAFSEDESKLDQRLRTSLIVRRQGPENCFVAVHQPIPEESAVRAVSRLRTEPKEMVGLKIDLAGGESDYFIYAPQPTRWHVRDGATKLTGDARVAWTRTSKDGDVTMKMLDGTTLQFGEHRLKGKTAGPAQLLAVDGNRLTVRGDISVRAGEVIVVEHGDGNTSAFHVASVEAAGATTVIETVEPPVLSGDASGELRMLTFPKLTLPGPHRVLCSSVISYPSNP